MKKINGELYYSITEIGYLVDKTKLTILRWYETGSPLLPEYTTLGKMNVRYWKADDIPKFKEFESSMTYGDMTNISNKYNGRNKMK